ncbi:MAG: hypothetical protein M3N19_12065, partial [Candidatus Eremiobacteraeota bacterium]|nr:hypothetical protein [Candidatus Eremiobacteraeota bacterium]
MNRLAGVVFIAAICALQGTAIAGPLNPDQAVRSLIAHGIIGRFPTGDFSAGHPLSRAQITELTEQAAGKSEGSGAELEGLQPVLAFRPAGAEHKFVPDAAQLRRFIGQTTQSGPMQPLLTGIALGSAPVDLMPTNAGAVASVRLAFVLNPRPGLVSFGPADGVPDSRIFAAPSKPMGGAQVADAVFGIREASLVSAQADVHATPSSSSGSVAVLNPGFARFTGFEASLPAGNTGLAGGSFRVYPVSGSSFEPGSLQSVSSAVTALRAPLKDGANFGIAPLTTLASASSFAYTPLSSNDAELSAGSLSAGQGLKADLSIPVRMGAFKAQGTLAALHLQELTPVTPFATSVRATEDQLTAGTKFDVHALGRPVSVNLSASYDRLLRNDRTAFLISNQSPAASNLSNEQLTVPSAPGGTTFNPNYVDVTRRSLGAAAAVPLTSDLSLNVQYKTQYYTGSYSALGQNVDGRKDSY